MLYMTHERYPWIHVALDNSGRTGRGYCERCHACWHGCYGAHDVLSAAVLAATDAARFTLEHAACSVAPKN